MKPLSMLYYIIGNRKKSLTMIVTITLCVGTVYYATLLAGSIFSTLQSKYLPDEHYSTLHTTNFQSIDPQVLEQLKQYEAVIDVIPFEREYTLYDGIISAEGVPVLGITKNSIQYLMDKLDLTIIEGRLPQSHHEIIFDERYVKNKGLKIGDFIGNEVNEKEQLLGRNQLVGIMRGEAMLGFRYLPEDTEIQSRAMVLLDHQNEEVMNYIESLSDLGYGNFSLKLSHMYYEKTSVLINTILSAIAVLIALVVGITLANISYIHLHHRKKEFSIIHALGYPLNRIRRRIFIEQFSTIVVGSAGGIVVSIGLTVILNILVYEPKGQSMIFIYPVGIPFVLLVPFAVVLINTLTAHRMLRKLDPISILEGRD